jgi:hypothetical protein
MDRSLPTFADDHAPFNPFGGSSMQMSFSGAISSVNRKYLP